ncbi:MAG: nuclear transport factor 2 family protein [Gammaproteobacteria bacterium]
MRPATVATWTRASGSSPTISSGRIWARPDCPARLKAGIRTSIEQLVAEGDIVVALTSGSAETTDGRAYDNRYCQVIRLRDGKFVEVREYFDTALVQSIFGSASGSE